MRGQEHAQLPKFLNSCLVPHPHEGSGGVQYVLDLRALRQVPHPHEGSGVQASVARKPV